MKPDRKYTVVVSVQGTGFRSSYSETIAGTLPFERHSDAVGNMAQDGYNDVAKRVAASPPKEKAVGINVEIGIEGTGVRVVETAEFPVAKLHERGEAVRDLANQALTRAVDELENPPMETAVVPAANIETPKPQAKQTRAPRTNKGKTKSQKTGEYKSTKSKK